MMVFTLVGSAHGFLHHHHHSESEEQDCAFCSYYNHSSQTDLADVCPDLVPVFLLLFTVAVFLPSFQPVAFSAHSGRAPPALLS
jgi:hypothetical protein